MILLNFFRENAKGNIIDIIVKRQLNNQEEGLKPNIIKYERASMAHLTYRELNNLYINPNYMIKAVSKFEV